MQIMIEIPKQQYENLAKIANAGEEPLGYLERVIMRGTQLPKEHGQLIRAAQIIKDFCSNHTCCDCPFYRETCGKLYRCEFYENVPWNWDFKKEDCEGE